MGLEFFQTVMGHRFYEGDVPRISRSLESIAKSLEKIADHLDRKETDLLKDCHIVINPTLGKEET